MVCLGNICITTLQKGDNDEDDDDDDNNNNNNNNNYRIYRYRSENKPACVTFVIGQ
jgi:hypothetical protein